MAIRWQSNKAAFSRHHAYLWPGQPFLNDFRGGEVSGTITTVAPAADGIFLKDDRISIRESLRNEGLLLQQNAKVLEDHIFGFESFLLGTPASVLQKIKLRSGEDGFIFNEERFTELEKQILDLLLLGDSASTSAAAITVLLITDGLFLNDFKRSELQKQILDLLLISDTRNSILVKQILDLILVVDSRFNTVEKQILNLLLLGDTRRSELTKKVLDFLLVSDTQNKELSKSLIDFLLLGDSADLETILGILAVLVTDGILFDDFDTKIRELVIENKLLLGDETTIETILDAITSIPPRILVELIQTLLDDN